MPIEIQREGSLLVAHFRGAVTVSEFLVAAEETSRIELAEPVTPDRIVDLSEVEQLLVDYTAMFEFAQIRSAAPLKNAVMSAVIAPSELHFGFARMYQNLLRHPQIELKVFRDRETAEAWLKEGAAQQVANV